MGQNENIAVSYNSNRVLKRIGLTLE